MGKFWHFLLENFSGCNFYLKHFVVTCTNFLKNMGETLYYIVSLLFAQSQGHSLFKM